MSSTDRKLSETTQITVLTGTENVPFFKGLMNGFFELSLIKKFITKQDVGLGNVDDTADIDKPVSNPQKLALDNKANVNHNHSSQDITDFNTAVNNNVDPKLLQKSNINHTHIANNITDFDPAVHAIVDPLLLQKSDIGHTHPDLGGSTIELPDSGLLKVSEVTPDTIARAIPAIDYVSKDHLSFFTRPEVPSNKILPSVFTEYNTEGEPLVDNVTVNWDILKHQVLFLPADYYINNINILVDPTSISAIADQEAIMYNANPTDPESTPQFNWKNLVGTQYQVIINATTQYAVEYIAWDQSRFLWPDGEPYVFPSDIEYPALFILNFELVAKPASSTISLNEDSYLLFNANDMTDGPYLAFLGGVGNLKPANGGSQPPPPDLPV